MKFFTLFTMLMLSVACTSPSLDTPSNETFIAPGLSFELPPWQVPERPVEAIQMLSGKFKDQTFSFQARISLDNQRLKITVLDPLGRRAFEILWDEQGVTSNKADWVLQNISANNILADMIFIFWPVHFLEKAIKKSDIVKIFDLPEIRMIHRLSDQPVVVSYSPNRQQAWNGIALLSNFALDYELAIESSELKP